MPSTFKNPTKNLRLRIKPASESRPAGGVPAKNPDGSVPRELWTLFQSTLLRALTPFKEPRERVAQAILDLEANLGFTL